MEVSVIIPSLAEGENLRILLPQLPPEYEVIVVEGRELEEIRALVAQVRPATRVIGQDRRGKGNAMLHGCVAATGRYLVMLDADGSAAPQEIPRFIAALRAGADFAKGTRYHADAGSDDLTAIRSWGNRALCCLANLLLRTNYTDLCYGYNAFRADILPRLRLPAVAGTAAQWGDGFEIETLFSCRIARAGVNWVEVPSHEYHRIHGRSNLHAWEDGKRVLFTILYEWLSSLRTPLK